MYFGRFEMVGFLLVLAVSRALLVFWPMCKDFLLRAVFTNIRTRHLDVVVRVMHLCDRNTTLLSSQSQGQRNANELFYYVTRVIALENQHSQVPRDVSDLIIHSQIHIDSNRFQHPSSFLYFSFTFIKNRNRKSKINVRVCGI